MWQWLKRHELPKTYNSLAIAHKADAIRMALISKYGGVWMDASVLLLKPLDSLLGSDGRKRVSFYLDIPFVITTKVSIGRDSCENVWDVPRGVRASTRASSST